MYSRVATCFAVKCLLVCGGFLASAMPAAGQESGIPFLQVGINAAGLAQGDAYVAQTKDAFSVYWNPAGLAAASGNTLAASHHVWAGDLRTYALGARFRLGRRGSVGLIANAVDVGENGDPGGEPDVLFGARFITTGAAYAHSFGPLRAGLTMKYISERFFSYDISGYAVDLGAQADLFQGALQLGAALNNIGRLSEVQGEATSLPRSLRVGAAIFPFQIRSSDGESVLNVSFTGQVSHALTKDADAVRSSATQIHAGASAEVLELVTLRAGYLSGDELRTISLGAGIVYGSFAFDYAYLPFKQGFSAGHVLTMAYTL